MGYKETDIKRIAEVLKRNKDTGKSAALLIGAGVSVSAGIPLANRIIEIIRERYKHNCSDCKEDSYTEHMKALSPDERRGLINELIENSKLNAAHLYMASLIKAGYISRVLTLNFDTLVAKALALENIFPGIYDIASIADNFESGLASDISIFHLHGQKDGMLLLNTDKECKENDKTELIIKDTIDKHTLIVVGYSGNSDPDSNHFSKIKKFGKRLYWIGYNYEEPNKFLRKEILEKDECYAEYLKGYDADSFFMKLANELEVDEPRIIKNPFSYLMEVVKDISEIKKDNKSTDPVKETKSWIDYSIRIFEEKEALIKVFPDIKKNIRNEDLIKLARESWLNNKYRSYEKLKRLIKKDSPKEAIIYFANFLNDWGVHLDEKAEEEKNDELKEKLFEEAIEKYKEAIEYNPDDHDALANLGLSFEHKELYDEAIEYYMKSMKLNPNDYDIYINMGNAYFAKDEIDKAIEYYLKAIKIKVDCYVAYNNLGNVYDEIEEYNKAIEYYLKAIEIKPDYYDAFYNLGNAYNNKMEYDKAIKYFKKSIAIKHDYLEAYNNIGFAYYNKKEYDKAMVYFQKTIDIKEDYIAFYNIGLIYNNKNDYENAIKYYLMSIDINPNNFKAYQNISEVYILINKPNIGKEILLKGKRYITDKEEKVIWMWLIRICEIILDEITGARRKEFKKIMKEEFIVTWNFDDIKEWMENLAEGEKKNEIIWMTEEMKKHLKKD